MAQPDVESLEQVKQSDPAEWIHMESGGRYGVPAWIHKSGVILAVRGPNKRRITLHPPYTDPREVSELDGRYVEHDARRVAKGIVNHE